MSFVTLLILLISYTNGELCKEKNSVQISDGQSFYNGTVIKDFPPEDTFMKNVSGELKTFGCLCRKRNCFRKCCPLGTVMSLNERKCVEKPESDLILHQGLNLSFIDSFRVNVDIQKSGFDLVFGRPCEAVYFEDDGHWILQEDGSLYVALPNSIPPWIVRDSDHYCIDTFLTEDSSGISTRLDALICFAEKQDNRKQYIASSTCMLISCVFILATVAVYAWLPELRNLHGKVLMAYLMCLFVGFAFLASMQILLVIDNITMTCCTTLTIIIYFSLLAAFFWLNVMCFDIWWTFSGKRGLSLERLSVRGRFVAYALYAFGIPTALTILLASLEFSGLPPHPLMPMLRKQGCFIFGKSKLLYLYGPIVLLCVANMIFFVLTAMKITQIKKETSVLKSKESSTHDPHRNDRQRLLLYMKLFVVMGVNWILEVISAIYPEFEKVWRFTDAYNVLIGLIIFVIFVCKRKIFRLIKKRVKEKFLQSKGDHEQLRDIKIKNLQLNQDQRASLDTIRTSIGVDPDISSISNSTKTSQL